MDVIREHTPKTTRKRTQIQDMRAYFERSPERREEAGKKVKAKMEGYLHEIWACVIFRPFVAPTYGAERSTEFDAAAEMLKKMGLF
jgi:hypothetical protein